MDIAIRFVFVVFLVMLNGLAFADISTPVTKAKMQTTTQKLPSSQPTLGPTAVNFWYDQYGRRWLIVGDIAYGPDGTQCRRSNKAGWACRAEVRPALSTVQARDLAEAPPPGRPPLPLE